MLSDDYSARLGLRQPRSEYQGGDFDQKMKDLYEYMQNLRKESEAAELGAGGQQSGDDQEALAEQQQQQAQMQQQQQEQMFSGLQNALQTVQSMDPIQRWQVGKELRAYQNALGGASSGPDFRLSDSQLAAKSYPSVFGAPGMRAQQILLASGALKDRGQHLDGTPPFNLGG